MNEIILALRMLLKESGSSLGYRRIHQKLRQLACFIDKETVRLCLKMLDPAGVELEFVGDHKEGFTFPLAQIILGTLMVTTN